MSDAGKAAADTAAAAAAANDTGKSGGDAGKVAADAGKAADAGAKADAGKAAADAGDKGGKAASILEGDVADLKAGAKAGEDGSDKGKAAAAAQTWPDDWRTQMAGGDAATEKLLKRYASPASAAAALKNLRTRVDSGEFRKPLADNPTDDELAAYRKDNGIPAKPDDYALPDGLKISDADKPIIDNFKAYAHERNWTPEQVKDIVAWRYAALEQENQQMYDADMAYRTENEDALRAEYGQEFRGNINGLKSFLETSFGPDIAGAILGARLGDGSLAGNNSGFIKGMINLMKEVNPAATLTLPNGDRGGKGVDARIAELEALQKKDITAWQSESNKAAQDEYLELLRTREKLAARAA